MIQNGKDSSPSVVAGVSGPDERIPAERAYRILGYRSQQAFNHSRSRMQRAVHRSTGVHLPVPDFGPQKGLVTPSELKRRRDEFFREHILVVEEWGGIKFPGSSWTYSLRRCEAIRDHGLAAHGGQG